MCSTLLSGSARPAADDHGDPRAPSEPGPRGWSSGQDQASTNTGVMPRRDRTDPAARGRDRSTGRSEWRATQPRHHAGGLDGCGGNGELERGAVVGRIRVGLSLERERATHDVRAGNGAANGQVDVRGDVTAEMSASARDGLARRRAGNRRRLAWRRAHERDIRRQRDGEHEVEGRTRSGMALDACRDDDSSSSDWACAASVERQPGVGLHRSATRHRP